MDKYRTTAKALVPPKTKLILARGAAIQLRRPVADLALKAALLHHVFKINTVLGLIGRLSSINCIGDHGYLHSFVSILSHQQRRTTVLNCDRCQSFRMIEVARRKLERNLDVERMTPVETER